MDYFISLPTSLLTFFRACRRYGIEALLHVSGYYYYQYIYIYQSRFHSFPFIFCCSHECARKTTYKNEIAQSAKAKNKWELSEKYFLIGNRRIVFKRTAAMKWCRTIYFSRSNILLFDIIFHKTVKHFLVFVRAFYRLNLMGSCTKYLSFIHACDDLGRRRKCVSSPFFLCPLCAEPVKSYNV